MTRPHEDPYLAAQGLTHQDDPYLAALELVKIHHGTSGQAALAKAILSLYNRVHAFSPGEILGPLDDRYTRVVLAMFHAYAIAGETTCLRVAGEYVVKHFPGLMEISRAQQEGRAAVHRKWDEEREEQWRQEEEAERQREAERVAERDRRIAAGEEVEDE